MNRVDLAAAAELLRLCALRLNEADRLARSAENARVAAAVASKDAADILAKLATPEPGA